MIFRRALQPLVRPHLGPALSKGASFELHRGVRWCSSKPEAAADPEPTDSASADATEAAEASEATETAKTAEATETVTVDKQEWEQLQMVEAESKKKVMYALAEMENVRKRTAKEIMTAKKYASQDLAKDLLGVSDNLQLALKNVASSGAMALMEGDSEEAKALKNLHEGLELTHKGLQSLFARHDISHIESLDKPFDANIHDCLFEVDSDKEPGTVAVVVKEGYHYKDRVLRPAQVGTVRAK